MTLLNLSSFNIPGTLHLVDTGTADAPLPIMEIATLEATARIALQGAQVLQWQPAGAAPVLWVSRAAVYQSGKGVRGGVPVCWPWFGAGAAGQPAHGFVRTRMWQLRETAQQADGVLIRMGIQDSSETRALWDHAFDLELRVLVGKTLTMELITHNSGTPADGPFTITQALHTYFCAGDIVQTQVLGLADSIYLDKAAHATTQLPQLQNGAVRFTAETDRIYVNTPATCVIDDAAQQRKIHIAKQGSHATVVWNPWIEKEKTFADMASGEYQRMLCVETCNAANDTITLAPGATHHLIARVSVEG